MVFGPPPSSIGEVGTRVLNGFASLAPAQSVPPAPTVDFRNLVLPERARSLLALTLSSLGYRVEDHLARIALDRKEGERRHSVLIKGSERRVALHLPPVAITGVAYSTPELLSLPFLLVESYRRERVEIAKEVYIFAEGVDGPAGSPHLIFETFWLGQAKLTPKFIPWIRVLEAEKALEEKEYVPAVEYVVSMFDLEPQPISAATMADQDLLIEYLSEYQRLGHVGEARWTFLVDFAGIDKEIVKEIPLGDHIPQRDLARSLLSRLLVSPKDLRSLLSYMAEKDAEYPPVRKQRIIDVLQQYV